MIVLWDYISNGYKSESLDLLSIIALLLGSIVIIVKNPVWSLISLIGLFGSISVYLILIGLDFIGFSYLIVYIGAVSILFLFIVLLINIRKSELSSYNANSIPLAVLVLILLNYIWLHLFPENATDSSISYNLVINSVYNNMFADISNTIKSFFVWSFAVANQSTKLIMFVASNNWDGSIIETSHIASIGMILYTVYSIWLLLVSIILLLAMVGTIVITLKV